MNARIDERGNPVVGNTALPAATVEAARQFFVAEYLAAVPADGETETVTIPKPVVPFGPDHLTEDEGTAHYLREVERKIGRDLDGTGIVGRLADMLAGWLPIPEGSAD